MSENIQPTMADVTGAVMGLMAIWQLDEKQMHQLLGMPDNIKPRAMGRYARGEAVLPDDQAVMKRAQYLLRIGEALRTAYPLNPKMIGRWMHLGQRRFNRRTPLSMILDEGEDGLVAVLSEIDCTFSWDCSGSSAVTYGSSAVN